MFEGGGLNREGGLIREGGLFNLAKRITGSKKRGRNRLELQLPTSCFGPGQCLSNIEI